MEVEYVFNNATIFLYLSSFIIIQKNRVDVIPYTTVKRLKVNKSPETFIIKYTDHSETVIDYAEKAPEFIGDFLHNFAKKVI